MIEYFDQNMHAFWFTAGFLLLAIELTVLGLSTGFVLFVGLAALVTGGLLWAGLIPATWMAGIASLGIGSVVVSALLWRPFKALQDRGSVPDKDNSSDLIGYEFRLARDISIQQPGQTQYSGIEWQVAIDKSCSYAEIKAGELVSVSSVDAGKFYVTRAGE